MRFLTILVLFGLYTAVGFVYGHYANFIVSLVALITLIAITINHIKPFKNKNFINNTLTVFAIAISVHILYSYSLSDLKMGYVYPTLSILLIIGIMFRKISQLVLYYSSVIISLFVIFLIHSGHLTRHGDFISVLIMLVIIMAFYIPLLIQRIRQEENLVRIVEEKTRELQNTNRALEIKVDRGVQEMRSKDAILIQQGKLSAMGEMMANIAHQWKQPLNALGVIIQNLKEYYDMNLLDKDFMSKNTARSLLLIQHMSHTIEDFRNFFKPDKEKKTFYFRDAVEKTVAIVDDSFRNNFIDIELEAEHGLKTEGYPGEFSQAVLNILTNAKDEFTSRKITGAKVKIRIFRESECTVIGISNNAGNIDENILPRIFDPYFTTKPSGSGIGLYMTRMIVEKSLEGKITARNIPDGVEFRIEIPLKIIHID